MTQKSAILRDLFKNNDLIRIVGAHNALSAKLIEKNEFDGIWSSGFEISAAHGVPDANILCMTDYVNRAIQINEATKLPVVVDADTGYGNANNVMHMVRKFEDAGIAAVCMEDKKFPKVNSYISGRQELASIAEFVGKITAAKSVQRTKDFMVIARVEALIAGWGMKEALKRARAYIDAGADAILMHSKQKTPDEIREFIREWNNYAPLVIVPTSYPSLQESEMKTLGVKMVIYANQGIRAAVKAMDEVLAKVHKEGISTLQGEIASMQEVFELQGMFAMKDSEKKFLKEERDNIKVIIPAGGKSDQESFKDILQETPVCMLDISGKTLLQRIVDAFRSRGIKDISVITGYGAEKVEGEGIKKIHYEEHDQGGVLGATMHPNEQAQDKVIVCFSDIFIDPGMIEKLVQSDKDITIVIDPVYKENTTRDDLDYVIAADPPAQNGRILETKKMTEIKEIGKKIDQNKVNYNFIGLAMFSKEAFDELQTLFNELKESYQGPFGESENFQKANLYCILQYLISKGKKVYGLEVREGWSEVHTLDDYKRITKHFSDAA